MSTKTDSVIEDARAALALVTAKVKFAETRLAEVRGTIVRPDGNLRSNASFEAARRAEEFEALKTRAKSLDTALADAVADLPRREAERQKATEADRDAARINSEARELRSQVEALEAAEARKLAEAESHRRAARLTKKQIEAEAA